MRCARPLISKRSHGRRNQFLRTLAVAVFFLQPVQPGSYLPPSIARDASRGRKTSLKLTYLRHSGVSLLAMQLRSDAGIEIRRRQTSIHGLTPESSALSLCSASRTSEHAGYSSRSWAYLCGRDHPDWHRVFAGALQSRAGNSADSEIAPLASSIPRSSSRCRTSRGFKASRS